MDQLNMVGKGLLKEEEIMINCGFSVSVGNIIESSVTGLGSSEKQYSSPDKSPVTVKNGKRGNPGKSSNMIRKKISSQTRVWKTTNLTDDGCGWRKYGQKIIHNQQYPKNYYRCTHQKEENCKAKKWIQQESENPPIYKTTYIGYHTCKNPLKIPQVFFSDISSMSLSSSSDNILESFDGNCSSVNQPFSLNFYSDSNHISHVDEAEKSTDHQMGLNDNQSSTPISTVDSTMFSTYEAFESETYEFESNNYFPSIPSPSCSFGSYDFNMMLEDYLLDLDNLNPMEEY